MMVESTKSLIVEKEKVVNNLPAVEVMFDVNTESVAAVVGVTVVSNSVELVVVVMAVNN